jgi:hypothetical protein
VGKLNIVSETFLDKNGKTKDSDVDGSRNSPGVIILNLIVNVTFIYYSHTQIF